jgi:dethiobiotin synthase
MSNILFVTGTDTGVGKTVVSRLLVAGLRQRGVSVCVVKPVETGCAIGADGELLAADATALWQANGESPALEDVVPYRFVTPVAPAVAAMKEDRLVDFDFLVEHLQRLSSECELLVVEGAGGLLVPLDEVRTFADLAKHLEMTVLLVVASRLGCINHAALTLEVLRNRGLDLLGYVLNEGLDGDASDESRASNRLSVSRAAAGYDVNELACLSAHGQLGDLAMLAEVAGASELRGLFDAVIEEFGLR